MDVPKKWQKILYKKHNYADNYFDKDAFLEGLRKNENVHLYTYLEVFTGMKTFMVQCDTIILYYVAYYLILSESVPKILLFSMNVCIPAIWLIWLKKTNIYSRSDIYESLKNLFVCCLIAYGGSPIIKTLATEIDTDTIYVSSALIFTLSLLFHDFGLSVPMVNTNFSTSLCLAASVFLISRLQNTSDSYYMLVLSYGLFNTFPKLRNVINDNVCSLLSVSVVTASLISTFLLQHYLPLFMFYIFCHACILRVVPRLFIKAQEWKETIHGPWDEATVRTN
uniref:Phosphatidylinositol N-acetylglucosaminyltransferase subunit C n=1 Tax=Rhabditophanes sp. KR3021 TaxID=114890 RepID=A0AC35TZC3_9BILA